MWKISCHALLSNLSSTVPESSLEVLWNSEVLAPNRHMHKKTPQLKLKDTDVRRWHNSRKPSPSWAAVTCVQKTTTSLGAQMLLSPISLLPIRAESLQRHQNETGIHHELRLQLHFHSRFEFVRSSFSSSHLFFPSLEMREHNCAATDL